MLATVVCPTSALDEICPLFRVSERTVKLCGKLLARETFTGACSHPCTLTGWAFLPAISKVELLLDARLATVFVAAAGLCPAFKLSVPVPSESLTPSEASSNCHPERKLTAPADEEPDRLKPLPAAPDARPCVLAVLPTVAISIAAEPVMQRIKADAVPKRRGGC